VLYRDKSRAVELQGTFANYDAKVGRFAMMVLEGKTLPKGMPDAILNKIRNEPLTVHYLTQLVQYANDLYKKYRILRRDAQFNSPGANMFIKERVCMHMIFER